LLSATCLTTTSSIFVCFRGYYCAEPEIFNCAAGAFYAFYYPDEEDQQYLYQTYPEVVSPLEGVRNEHFLVWMQTMATSNFRKIYGRIDEDAAAGSVITFKIRCNFAVNSNKGKKFLVVSTTSWFGGKRNSMGIYMIILGSISGGIGVLFFAKNLHSCSRREIGDLDRLNRPMRRGLAGVRCVGDS